MSTCRSCHAEVRWGVTEQGNRMPLDAQPTENGNCTLDVGGVIRVHTGMELAAIKTLGTPLFVSHFATCAQGSQWRLGR